MVVGQPRARSSAQPAGGSAARRSYRRIL